MAHALGWAEFAVKLSVSKTSVNALHSKHQRHNQHVSMEHQTMPASAGTMAILTVGPSDAYSADFACSKSVVWQ